MISAGDFKNGLTLEIDKTKPRQNAKGDQLGTWDFRDNVWDTHISV